MGGKHIIIVQIVFWFSHFLQISQRDDLCYCLLGICVDHISQPRCQRNIAQQGARSSNRDFISPICRRWSQWTSFGENHISRPSRWCKAPNRVAGGVKQLLKSNITSPTNLCKVASCYQYPPAQLKTSNLQAFSLLRAFLKAQGLWAFIRNGRRLWK